MNIYHILKRICQTKTNVNLKNLCSIKIGGVAKLICYPSKTSQVKKLIKVLKQLKQHCYVIGNGTNIVFEDGSRDIVLICTQKLNKITIKNNKVAVQCGKGLFALNKQLCDNYLCGLEWSYGIPGSIGGATIMNAGAFEHELKEFVIKCLVLNNGKYKVLTKKQMGLTYRNSALKTKNMLVLKTILLLTKNTKSHIKEQQLIFLNKRRLLQPYDMPSCGSVFLKTTQGSAGKIIDKMGLKGVKLGGMQISPKHANFFVNLGNATSSDMHGLIDMVKDSAKKQGVVLSEEVIFI